MALVILETKQGHTLSTMDRLLVAPGPSEDAMTPYLVAVNFSARLLWKTPPETSVELLRREELQERLDYAAAAFAIRLRDMAEATPEVFVAQVLALKSELGERTP